MWTARWLSSIGDGLVFVAFPLLAVGLTRSAVLVAGVVFATRLPWLIFALPGGAIADRVSRRRLLAVVEVARMTLLALLGVAIVTHRLVLIELYLAAFLINTLETMFNSATMAVIPQVVGEGGDLVRANSRFQAAEMSGEQFIGPAIGGALFAVAASLPVFADGASFAASAGLLMLALRPRRRRKGRAHIRRDDFALIEPPRADGQRSLVADVKSGLAWLLHEPHLLLLCGLIATFAFSQGLGFGIIVIYCTRALHLTGTGFGIFMAITGSGNFVGAWLAPRVHERLGSGRTLCAAGIACGAAFVVVGLTSTTGVAAVALAVEALGLGIGMVASVALRQSLIPLALAGRVSATIRSITVGSGALATLVGGALVALLNARLPFLVGGLAQIAAAVLIGGALARRLAAQEGHVVDLTDVVDLTEQPLEV